MSPQKTTLVHDNLAQERRDAKKAAKASAEHAKKDKVKKNVNKVRRQEVPLVRFQVIPIWSIFVAVCRRNCESRQMSKVINLMGGLLPGSQSNATIMADLKQCNTIINGLKEDMRRAREEDDQDKIKHCGEHIK